MQDLCLLLSPGGTMNHSLKFLRHTRRRDFSVPEKTCTIQYRGSHFLSIYCRLLIFGLVPPLRSSAFLTENISLWMNLCETPLNRVAHTVFEDPGSRAQLVPPRNLFCFHAPLHRSLQELRILQSFLWFLHKGLPTINPKRFSGVISIIQSPAS
ncbi:MAG: hypothetical protein H6Q48_4393 [Deltaproteobacteria bacterium]|nr:hypothetical protein [Deltaproteobacteria bacterium]